MNRKFMLMTALVTVLALLFAGMGEGLYRQVRRSSVTPCPLVLIDAGHGGFDGGAVAADGTVEKDINLAMATDLSVVLRLMGYRVQMTRQEDVALCEDPSLSIRENKRADMAERLALYDSADAVISIHQNHFPDTACKGTQLWYSPNNSGSEVLGRYVRESVLQNVQPDNTRELKAGTKDVLLLHRTTSPAVLVECGFLSNPQECENMKTSGYRLQLALAIAEGLIHYQP